jgi:hypothetical protein
MVFVHWFPLKPFLFLPFTEALADPPVCTDAPTINKVEFEFEVTMLRLVNKIVKFKNLSRFLKAPE